MVVTALLDHVVAAHPPETEARAHGRHLLAVAARRALAAQRVAGYALLDKYARDLPGVEQMTVASMPNGVFSYLNGQRLKSYLKRTDGEYWQILDFHFLEGGPYTDADVARPSHGRGDQRSHAPALLRRPAGARAGPSRPTASASASSASCPTCSILRLVPSADIWVPHTTAKSDSYTREYIGDFMGILLLEDPSKLALTRDELWSRLRTVKPDDPGFERLDATPETLFDAIGRMFTGDGKRRRQPATAAACDRADRRGAAVHAAAGGEPGEPQRQPHPGAGLGDRRAQGLRRLVAHAGRPVRRREPGADAGRAPASASSGAALLLRSSTPAA